MSDLHATDRRALCLAGESERAVASAPWARNTSRRHVLDEVLPENPVKSRRVVFCNARCIFPKGVSQGDARERLESAYPRTPLSRVHRTPFPRARAAVARRPCRLGPRSRRERRVSRTSLRRRPNLPKPFRGKNAMNHEPTWAARAPLIRRSSTRATCARPTRLCRRGALGGQRRTALRPYLLDRSVNELADELRDGFAAGCRLVEARAEDVLMVQLVGASDEVGRKPSGL